MRTHKKLYMKKETHYFLHNITTINREMFIFLKEGNQKKIISEKIGFLNCI